MKGCFTLFALHVFSFPFSCLAESLVVMLSLLFTILDEGGQAASGAKLLEYIALVEESDGFDRIMGLMNDHDDMDVYDKVGDARPAPHDAAVVAANCALCFRILACETRNSRVPPSRFAFSGIT